MQMDWVEVKRGDTFHRFENRRKISGHASTAGHGEHATEVRTMDCIDCHNRATHVYQTPEDVVDNLLAEGAIDAGMPWAKAAGLAALNITVPEGRNTEEAIGRALRGYYRRKDPEVLKRFISQFDVMTVELAKAYERNVHPAMLVDWGNYPSHLGHRQGQAGCFRCHNSDMVDEAGESISSDCTLCHSILAFESPTPFRYLEPVQTAQPDSAMHVYLQAEFTGGVQ